VWDIKYRPLKFADVLGQPGTVQVLKARVRNGTVLDTNYLFSGGAGQGKTTLGRILARAALCQQLDKEACEPCNECDNCRAILEDTSLAFTEKDAASQGTVENMRGLVEDLPFAVFGAPKRIYLFDEAHRMSKDAQDVLLKPLEEKRMIGMFATTEPDKIRGAIRSRCDDFAIRKVPRDEILGRMKMVLQAEGVEGDDDGICVVIDYCGGHVRDVLNKLEMIAQGGKITVESARAHLNLSLVTVYYQILLGLSRDRKEAIGLIDQACDRVGPEEVAAGLAEAAMNSFRLAQNMVADFASADPLLGRQVYETYKDGCIRLAKFFLGSRYTSPVSLVCDALTLSQNLGQQGGIPDPMVADTGVPILVPVASRATASEQPAVAPMTTASPSLPQAPKAPPPAALPPATAKPRSPVGNTISNNFVPEVPGEYEPRKERAAEPKKVAAAEVPKRPSPDDDVVTPSEWKSAFATLMGNR
jgi:DNA polymerase III subunit gamma/tau